jgi:hypothetical protein
MIRVRHPQHHYRHRQTLPFAYAHQQRPYHVQRVALGWLIIAINSIKYAHSGSKG